MFGLAYQAVIAFTPSWVTPGAAFDTRPYEGLAWINGQEYTSWAALLASGRATFARASQQYAENAAGVYSLFNSGVAAITDKGLLVEPSETQYLAYTDRSTNFTAAGTANGLSRSISGTGTAANGLPYAEITITGTPTATSSVGYYFDATTAVSAAQGDNWTVESWADIIDATGVSSVILTITERGAGGASLSSTTNGTAITSGARSKLSRTFTNASAQFAVGGVLINYTNGVPVNAVLRVYGFNLIKATVATFTSPLSNATGTRPSTRAAVACTLFPPARTYDITVTFDDNSTQTLTSQSVTGSGWAIPTNLNRAFIKKIVGR